MRLTHLLISILALPITNSCAERMNKVRRVADSVSSDLDYRNQATSTKPMGWTDSNRRFKPGRFIHSQYLTPEIDSDPLEMDSPSTQTLSPGSHSSTSSCSANSQSISKREAGGSCSSRPRCKNVLGYPILLVCCVGRAFAGFVGDCLLYGDWDDCKKPENVYCCWKLEQTTGVACDPFYR